MTDYQINEVSRRNDITETILKHLFKEWPLITGIAIKELAKQDCKIARFCEKIGYETGSNWCEESQHEVLKNRLINQLREAISDKFKE